MNKIKFYQKPFQKVPFGFIRSNSSLPAVGLQEDHTHSLTHSLTMLKQNSFLKTHLFYWFTQSQYKVQNKTSGIDIRGQQFKSNHRLYFELCFQLLMLKRTVSQNKTRTFRATWGALTYRYRYGLWIIGGTLLAVWPEKIRQMSVKVAQKWFH